jgi:hypothetical protein
VARAGEGGLEVAHTQHRHEVGEGHGVQGAGRGVETQPRLDTHRQDGVHHGRDDETNKYLEAQHR